MTESFQSKPSTFSARRDAIPNGPTTASNGFGANCASPDTEIEDLRQSCSLRNPFRESSSFGSWTGT